MFEINSVSLFQRWEVLITLFVCVVTQIVIFGRGEEGKALLL